ncbi:MAG: dependent oxidoreductase [Caulobacter sp.]|nr:dependent oxidoreductase [Caulobacter sp.]
MTADQSAPTDLSNKAVENIDVVIVGAGFSGLYATYKFREELGLRVRTFEAGRAVGGTWNWNRYPGARCDSEGYVYCFSFSKELLEEWTWSGKYPEQPELLRYLDHVAERFDLKRDIELNTWVRSAKFDDASSRWIITTDKGERVCAKYFVAAVGQLTIAPIIPDIPGFADFQGEWHHTAQWPAEDVDMKGKRVGVIGTGSSGVQAIPIIAEEASHLTVFMRSPQYSVPARHETVTPEFLADVKANYDKIWEATQISAGGFPWQHNGKRARDVSEEERQAAFEALWQEGGQKFALGGFKDLLYNTQVAGWASDFIKSKIAQVVKDPQTRAALMPEHLFMSRRPIIDTNYFETYNRPNVSLVDLRRTPIVRMTPKGIETSEGEIELDVLVVATGFDRKAGPFFKMNIEGAHGLKLADAWADRAGNYLGLLSRGFPNMLMTTGPLMTAGNAPVAIQNNIDFFARLVGYMEENGVAQVEPETSAEEEWTDSYMAEAGRSVGSSYVKPEDAWKQGKKTLVLGHLGKFKQRLMGVQAAGFEGILFDGAPSPTAAAIERERVDDVA